MSKKKHFSLKTAFEKKINKKKKEIKKKLFIEIFFQLWLPNLEQKKIRNNRVEKIGSKQPCKSIRICKRRSFVSMR